MGNIFDKRERRYRYSSVLGAARKDMKRGFLKQRVVRSILLFPIHSVFLYACTRWRLAKRYGLF